MIYSAPVWMGVILAVLLALPAVAEVQQPQRQRVQVAPGTASKVPAAQRATVQKREQAKQQLDKKLKVREANVQSGGGQTTLRKPPGKK